MIKIKVLYVLQEVWTWKFLKKKQKRKHLNILDQMIMVIVSLLKYQVMEQKELIMIMLISNFLKSPEINWLIMQSLRIMQNKQIKLRAYLKWLKMIKLELLIIIEKYQELDQINLPLFNWLKFLEILLLMIYMIKSRKKKD